MHELSLNDTINTCKTVNQNLQVTIVIIVVKNI